MRQKPALEEHDGEEAHQKGIPHPALKPGLRRFKVLWREFELGEKLIPVCRNHDALPLLMSALRDEPILARADGGRALL
jgi:hypothetical protein